MVRAFCLMGLMLGIVLLYGAFYSPCTPPSQRSKCRKELGLIRGCLLSCDDPRCSFPWNDLPLSGSEIGLRVGDFFQKINATTMRSKFGKDVFRVVQTPDGSGRVIVDFWGTPYNTCSLTEQQENHWEKLHGSVISNIVIWSSGPNKKNEFGEGDDVVLR